AARNHREAVALEIEIANNLGAKEAVHVAGRGHLETGPRLFGHDAAAHQVAPFEHQHPAAGRREIRRRHQTVVAGADDDDVVAGSHDAGSYATSDLRLFGSSLTDLRRRVR